MENEQIEIKRHSMSHVLAKALCNLFPNTRLAIGPAIDNGFYYDIDSDKQITQEDAKVIEKEMHKIINKSEDFKRKVVSKKEALELFKNNQYKVELIKDLPDNETISIYYLGDDFFDLCKGPHVENTKQLKDFGFKFNKVNGAYWRGNEKNKMLQRLYFYGFENETALKEYLTNLEQALKRDHNKLGRELEIFTTVDYIGQGLPIMLPKGTKILQILQRFVEDEEERRGYLYTKTPFMAKSDLYKISGHWYHYRDGMFIIGDEKNEKEVLALRPMTCPFQFQAFLNRPRSYKDLPMRLAETSTLFRNEASGEMHGLIRLRQFTISEGHIACTPEQVEGEFRGCLELAQYFMKTLGLDNDISYRFSKWDENNKEKYIGSAEEWTNVQNLMRSILTNANIDFVEAEGEAAFYGPKLDIQIKNVFGKEDTLITIQIDFQLAQRFGMEYIDADSFRKHPYVIHRTSIGCYERTLALLIEKYAGAFPLWLSPAQVKILTVSTAQADYAKNVLVQLKEQNFRAELDDRNETMGKKIREAIKQKIPYIVIIGENEVAGNVISVRKRGEEQTNNSELTKFIEMLKNENDCKNKNCL